NRIFNYGAFLLNTGKEEDCLRWAAFASPKYPDSERWREFTRAAVNNRIQKLAKAGQFAAARELLERQKTAAGPENYALLDSMLTGTELFDRASKIRNSGEGDSVLDLIEIAHNSGLIDDNRADELVVLAVQRTAAILSAARPVPDSGVPGRDWPGAVNYIQKAAGRFGTSRSLERILRDYQTNYAIDFHNRFAAAWNKKNYDEARRVIAEGLALFPGNKQLLADKKLLE
ncbi:MAG: hypothetical protein LBD48_07895, partial [Treponema sp.]|nr:hypothetical protein [Treponema sp.]